MRAAFVRNVGGGPVEINGGVKVVSDRIRGGEAMGRRRGHRGRVDSNQREIVEALRKAGVSVLLLSGQGDGVPDLLVARAGQMWFLEVKTDKGQLTDQQERFFLTWPGEIKVVRNAEDALATVREHR